MKHSHLEIALLRKGINPNIIKTTDEASRLHKEHPVAKIERLQINPQYRRKKKKSADQKAGKIYTLKGIILNILYPR